MQMQDEIGKIREGYLADFIVVRGEPHKDVSCLTAENILAVVKDGEPYGHNRWRMLSAQPGTSISLS